jgi:hypothetical protein
MDSETRICQNCKKDFTIEPDDFGFYEKMKVRSVEVKEDWLGEMILFFIIEIAICVREELSPFTRPTIRK